MRQAYNNNYYNNYYNYTTAVRISNFGGKLNIDVYYKLFNFRSLLRTKRK